MHPDQLAPMHFNVRLSDGVTVTGDVAYPQLPIGCLVDGSCENPDYALRWTRARAQSFAPLL